MRHDTKSESLQALSIFQKSISDTSDQNKNKNKKPHKAANDFEFIHSSLKSETKHI